jgi:hypothetical protein
VIQSWSFALAWGIFLVGLVGIVVWVVRVERSERVEHDRWLSQRDMDRRRREAWLREMSGEV